MSLADATWSTFSTLRQEFLDAPATTYPGLRRGPPIFWSDDERAWVIHRYAEVAAALKDPRLAVFELGQSLRGIGELSGKRVEALACTLDEILFLRNPPAHTPAKQFYVAVLSDQPLAAHRARLEEIVGRLLADVREDQEWDAAAGYADLVPPLFMASLLGMSDEAALACVNTVTEVTKCFDRGRSFRFYERVSATVESAIGPLLEEIGRRRANPANDGLSRMIALSDSPLALSDEVLANRALFLMIGGVETTSALIGSTIAAIAARPELAGRIRVDPDLAAAAIEETLRFDGPVKQSSRFALTDLVIADQPLKAGDRLVLLIGAAHHDPTLFPEPERFDIDRRAEGLLGFGAGLHSCVGARLARLEARVAVSALLERGDLCLGTDGRTWLQHRTLRRLEHLPVTIKTVSETHSRG